MTAQNGNKKAAQTGRLLRDDALSSSIADEDDTQEDFFVINESFPTQCR